MGRYKGKPLRRIQYKALDMGCTNSGATTFRMTTLRMMTLSIGTINIKVLFAALNINSTQHR